MDLSPVLYVIAGTALVFTGLLIGAWFQKKAMLSQLGPVLLEAYSRGYKQALHDISESSKNVK